VLFRSGWQILDFGPRPVKTIRIKGLYNSANSGFYVVELEAYCIPPDTPPPKSKASRPARPTAGGPEAKAPPPPPPKKDAP
jgi:hypothetical protein